MLTIGLVNTYARARVHEAHTRSIARAAPVCHAFGFNLALFDYPFKMDASPLVEFVAGKTTIGRAGEYLRKLHADGRFYVLPLPGKGFFPQFGTVVVTTSHPESKKSVSLTRLAGEIKRRGSFLFLIGLGHRGLPERLFELAEYHLDITTKGIPLETCTAIGAVPAGISAALSSL
ncbi:MAG TPA: DUF531 family protein [Candidatus Methanoperedenaceae archaeon]|nr:DUF531 family protein [Candidatus Methanoperedenaceae archaeon]